MCFRNISKIVIPEKICKFRKQKGQIGSNYWYGHPKLKAVI